jgi:hypothetical protein
MLELKRRESNLTRSILKTNIESHKFIMAPSGFIEGTAADF